MRFFSTRRATGSIGMTLSVVLLLMIGVVSYLNAAASVRAARWVTHTQEVINALQGIVSGMAAAESALRGFSLNRDQHFLADMSPAVSETRSSLARASKLVADNGEQRERMRALAPLLERRLALLEEREAAVLAGGDPRVSLESQQLSADIRDRVAVMVAAEKTLLVQRNERTEIETERALTTMPAAAAVAIVLLLIVFAFLTREMSRRRSSEKDAQARLAEMVLLAQTGELLQACRSTDEAYELIAQLAPRFFTEQSGAVSMFRASRDFLEVRATWGADEVIAGGVLGPDDCWALRRGQLHVFDAKSSVRCKHLVADARASVCVPMLAQGEVLGTLQLRAAEAMPETAHRIAAVVAERIALALANLQLRETLRNQSIRDPLTGLYNRRYAEETLTRELARSTRTKEPLSILVMDVDHFKRFNDTFGHDAGDAVLKELADVLRRLTRGSDVASRMGGEELVVLLPAASPDDAFRRAEEIRVAVAGLALKHRGQSLGQVTISIGLASHPLHAKQAEDLVKAADAALYRAKHAGRNRVETAV